MTNKLKDILFIAEIGINHNGDLDTALKLINAAKEAGADCVKFQKRNPDICVPEKYKNVVKNTIFGEMPYIEYKRRMEFSLEQYKIIDEYCKSIEMEWTASVWDIDSLNFIVDNFDVPFIKIPSACITNIELLEAAAKTGKFIIVSTGMSNQREIEKAIYTIKSISDLKVGILNCNSSYPADEAESNILYMDNLKELFPYDVVGYSGHEKGILPTLVAASRGAKIIERHITLDNNMPGSDHEASLNLMELEILIGLLCRIENILGNDWDREVFDSELESLEKLRYIK